MFPTYDPYSLFMVQERNSSHPMLEKTPWLAARFHQIRYDANNHGVLPEHLNDLAYLRIFEEMGEKFALYDEARQRHRSLQGYKSLTDVDVGMLKEFGTEGFRYVMDVAERIAAISDKEVTSVSREDRREGLYKYTSLAPFIEKLEVGQKQPTPQDRQALRVYLSVLHHVLPQYPRLSLPKRFRVQ